MFKREYSEVRAVDGVSFKIEEGELVGFLGPQWGGKDHDPQDALRNPFSHHGNGEGHGFYPSERKNEYRRQFALVMGQKNQLWWDLPGPGIPLS